MLAKLVNHDGNEVTVQFTVKLTGSMLDDEQALQRSLNEAGKIAMQPMLKQFDKQRRTDSRRGCQAHCTTALATDL